MYTPIQNMKPLFDKTEFKKQMSKMFEMETESEKKAYQIKLQVQAEKEMRIIKAELQQGWKPPNMKSRPATQDNHCVEHTNPPHSDESHLLKDFYDYLSKGDTKRDT